LTAYKGRDKIILTYINNNNNNTPINQHIAKKKPTAKQQSEKVKMASPQRPTIEDFHLTRVPWNVFYHEGISFMDAYIDPDNTGAGTWLPNSVCDPRRSQQSLGLQNHYRLSMYAVSLDLRAYVVIAVFLTSGDGPNAERRTEMRHRDMVVDNYIAAGGDPKTWRWFSVVPVLNGSAIRAFGATFEEMGIDFTKPCTLEFSPHDPDPAAQRLVACNRDNQCVRGAESLVRHYGDVLMGGARVKRFIFVSEGYPGWVKNELDNNSAFFPGPANPDVHMLVEFFRPGEEGHPAPEASNT
jgi:hypothetical protein